MIGFRKIVIDVFGFFLCDKAASFPFFSRFLKKPPFMGLAFFFICLLPEQAYAQWWFNRDAVECKDLNNHINLGRVDGTLANYALSVGDFQGKCTSQAYVKSDSSSKLVAEAAYCLTIQSADSRNGVHYLASADGSGKIAVRFINLDTNLPIGDGTTGAPLFRRGQKYPGNVIGPPVLVPLDWSFGVELLPGAPSSSGRYIGTVNVVLGSGAERHKTYPDPGNPAACAGYPRREVFPVKIEAAVPDSCNLNVEQHVNFGVVTRLSNTTYGRGQIAVRCTAMAKFQVGISKGIHGPSPQQRLMRIGDGGTAMVDYNLFQDSAGSRLWTDDWNTSNVLRGTGTGASQYYNVYGIVPAQSLKPYGTYSDVVRVEVRMD